MFPKTSESRWSEYFEKLPTWQPDKLPTIVLTPHPDDEILGAGGLIADLQSSSIPVHIIAVTDGEKAYQNIEDLGKIRQSEQERALATLGINSKNITRLRYIDSNIAASEFAIEQYLLSIIKKPVNLIAPWKNDFHPDHESVGRVAERVALKTQSTLISYFFWTWHHAHLDIIKKLSLCIYPLSRPTQFLKNKAMSCYQSQLVNFQNNNPILPENLLYSLKREFEVFLTS
jgi:LmbE family N-acetylglucosaminyl deacetylase